MAGYLETLVSLGRHAEARTCGEEALARCRTLGIGFMSHGISRALALAEARRNDYAKAVARLDGLIADQKNLGVTGLNLGASYEARARIAIGADDEPSLEQYAELTAKEYRHGRGSALGARWERLMAEARRASSGALPRLADFQPGTLSMQTRASAKESVDELLRDASNAQERAARALRLLCEDRAARSGFLYLVGDAGLSLAASLGFAAPPVGLLEYLQEYFDREVSQSSDDTAALTDAQMASALTARASFRDGSGIDHHPVLMASLADGVSRYAGVAAFVECDGPERPAGDASLVAALSAHLIRSGDTLGFA
jgi:hypothetical protein